MSWFHWWTIPLIFTVWCGLDWVIDQFTSFKKDILRWIWNWFILGPMAILNGVVWGIFYLFAK